MVHIKDWILIRATRSDGTPNVTHMIFGKIESDRNHRHMPGETVLKTGILNVGQGIARAINDEIFKLSGPGRRIEIPNHMIGKAHSMTRCDWNNWIDSKKMNTRNKYQG